MLYKIAVVFVFSKHFFSYFFYYKYNVLKASVLNMAQSLALSISTDNTENELGLIPSTGMLY